MKSLKEMENISLEELEAVSLDETAAIPEGFRQRLLENIDAKKMIERLDEAGSSNRITRLAFTSTAASVAILAGISFSITRWQNEPKDTFDDPYQAYAELEKAFATMSSGIHKALTMTIESEEALDKATSVFE